MAATIKQTSVGKFQILSSRRLLVNLKYYEADDVNLGFESELTFLGNGKTNPNTNPKTLMMLNLTLTDPLQRL